MRNDVKPPPDRPILDLAGLPAPIVKSLEQLVESLRQRISSHGYSETTGQLPPLKGRFADLKLSISTEDLDEVQREVWANFPRQFPEPDRS
jgi:hypothetical protein